MDETVPLVVLMTDGYLVRLGEVTIGEQGVLTDLTAFREFLVKSIRMRNRLIRGIESPLPSELLEGVDLSRPGTLQRVPFLFRDASGEMVEDYDAWVEWRAGTAGRTTKFVSIHPNVLCTIAEKYG